MAKKVQAAQAAQATAPGDDPGADDMSVLQPDDNITIAGQVVTVREYRFFEGLRVRAKAQPFFDDLYAMFGVDGASPGFDDVADLCGQHEALVLDLVATSTGCDVDWIRDLSDSDGDRLLVAWWQVNAGFFIRRVLRQAAQAGLEKYARSAGPGSSTTSSPAATSSTRTNSPDSRDDR